MGALLARWLISAASIWLVSALGLGVHVKGVTTALVAALVLGLVDLVLRPLLIFFTLPITVATLGLFLFVVNGILLWVVSLLVPGFSVKGLWGAILASFLIGVAAVVIQAVLKLV